MLKKILNWFKSEAEKYAEDTKVIDFPLETPKKRPQVRKATTRKEKNMPLKKGTSNKTRSENIAKEIRAGKLPKQAEAIGYAVQRETEKKKGKKK